MKTILVVDDEMLIRDLVRMTLEDEFVVLAASCGEDALAAARDAHPHLILLDIMMPRMDGYTVLRQLKKQDSTKNIPVIVLTAKHELDDIRRAVALNVDEYLTKPFEPEDLIGNVKSMIG